MEKNDLRNAPQQSLSLLEEPYRNSAPNQVPPSSTVCYRRRVASRICDLRAIANDSLTLSQALLPRSLIHTAAPTRSSTAQSSTAKGSTARQGCEPRVPIETHGFVARAVWSRVVAEEGYARARERTALARRRRFYNDEPLFAALPVEVLSTSKRGGGFVAATSFPDSPVVFIHGGHSVPAHGLEAQTASSTLTAIELELEATLNSEARNARDSGSGSDLGSGLKVRGSTFEFPTEIHLCGHTAVPTLDHVLFFGGVSPRYFGQTQSLFSRLSITKTRATSEGSEGGSPGDEPVIQLIDAGRGSTRDSERLPPGRARHSMCVDKTGKIAYMFGGHSHRSASHAFNDLWCLSLPDDAHLDENVEGNLEAFNWHRLHPQPHPHDPSLEVTHSQSMNTSDEEVFPRPLGPCKRFGHHMAFKSGEIFVAFGSDGERALLDIWAFDVARKHWREIDITENGTGVDLIGRVESAAAVVGRYWLFHGGVGLSPSRAATTTLGSAIVFDFVTEKSYQFIVPVGVPMRVPTPEANVGPTMPGRRAHSACTIRLPLPAQSSNHGAKEQEKENLPFRGGESSRERYVEGVFIAGGFARDDTLCEESYLLFPHTSWRELMKNGVKNSVVNSVLEEGEAVGGNR